MCIRDRSQGGDSIGGSIVVERTQPTFAAAGEGTILSGEIGAYYRSNGDARGANVAASLATEHFSARYTGSTARADDYRAGDDFKTYTFTGRAGHTLGRDVVGASAYVSHNQSLGVAYAWGDHLVDAKFGWQRIPMQGFPNQRMDLTDNRPVSYTHLDVYKRQRSVGSGSSISRTARGSSGSRASSALRVTRFAKCSAPARPSSPTSARSSRGGSWEPGSIR